MELIGRLKRAVKKLTFLLNLKKYLSLQSSLQLVSIVRSRAPAIMQSRPRWHRRRALSFNERPGLRACVDVDLENGDEHEIWSGGSGSGSGSSPYELRRTRSNPLEEDVDKRAEMFIANFQWHLIYERQVSLELSYCRDNSSNYSISPFSSTPSSSLLSPT